MLMMVEMMVQSVRNDGHDRRRCGRCVGRVSLWMNLVDAAVSDSRSRLLDDSSLYGRSSNPSLSDAMVGRTWFVVGSYV